MTRRTHLLTGLSIGIAFAPEFPFCIAALIGSTFPDNLDKIFSFGNKEKWKKMHRTWSHNVGYWLLLVLAIFQFYPFEFPFFWQRYLFLIGVFFGVGVISHIALDVLTPMGIPLCPLFSKQRFSLRMARTGKFFDTFAGFFFLTMALAYRFILTDFSLYKWFFEPMLRLHQ